jgi:hypothetical protein
MLTIRGIWVRFLSEAGIILLSTALILALGTIQPPYPLVNFGSSPEIKRPEHEAALISRLRTLAVVPLFSLTYSNHAAEVNTGTILLSALLFDAR